LPDVLLPFDVRDIVGIVVSLLIIVVIFIVVIFIVVIVVDGRHGFAFPFLVAALWFVAAGEV
jgi:hypothetical protein